MKIWQILLFLMCLNAAFFLLNITGLYFSDPMSDYNIASRWTVDDAILLLVGEFVTAIAVGVILSRYGVDPYRTAAYTVFLLTFVGLYYGFVKILYSVGTMMGPAKPLMDGFIVILTMVMGVLMMYSCVQMGTGGAKSFE